jgi:3-oxoacyl-[acyl-carrier-protein] synthase III
MTAYINAISYHLPDNIITNEEISRVHPEWSVEKISSKVGISQRHRSGNNETAGDLAFNAAEKLFKEHNIDRSSIDYILLCTQSPDYFLPSTSCILQHKLGLSEKCGALDFNLGCSGYIYGLGLAKGLILTNQAHNLLLLTSETYTKYLNIKDKGNKTMFGDAASATLISNKKIVNGFNAEMLDFCYGTDGSGYESLIVKNGYSRHPIHDGQDQFDEEFNFIRNDNNLYMDGKAIFNFTAFKIPPLIKETLKKNETSLEDIDQFIFHQANEFMLKTVRKRCGIPEEKFYIDIKDLGNTVSNTIPIALCKANTKGILRNAHTILISGFGVGLSMGAVILKK